MFDVPQRTIPVLDRDSLELLAPRVRQPLDSGQLADPTVFSIDPAPAPASRPAPAVRPAPAARPAPAPAQPAPQPSRTGIQGTAIVQPALRTVRQMTVPRLENCLARGQKTNVTPRSAPMRLRVCFGWNTSDDRCDIDASAFLLGANGRVPGDDWFVFYSQPVSPDGSVTFHADGGTDREWIGVDLAKLSPSIEKIVFVLTIDEALEKGLGFNSVRDVYVRLLDDAGGRELMSYRADDCDGSVTSMTVAELYLYRDVWKLCPVGNGVRQDLAGQCAIYGVEIDG